MRKWTYLILIFYAIILSTSIKASTNDSIDLIKVTPNANVKCVDYYSYQGELYCSTTPNPQPVDSHLKDFETLDIQFDDRPWKIGWGKKDADVTMIEYIPKGENIENWNELVTSQFFPGLQDKVTPKEFADLYTQKWSNSGYSPIVTRLKDSSDQVIIEIRINQPPNQAQDEMLMITGDDRGIYLLHYAVKTADMDQENRDKWLNNLMDTTIKK